MKTKIYFLIFIVCCIVLFGFFKIRSFVLKKDLYNLKINGVVTKIEKGRRDKIFYLNNNKPIYLYSNEEEMINVNDSIYKGIKSNKVDVYTKIKGLYQFSYSININEY